MDLVISDIVSIGGCVKLFEKKNMKNKLLPFFVILIFGIIFIIFYKGLRRYKYLYP